jgi:hypothetical protein
MSEADLEVCLITCFFTGLVFWTTRRTVSEEGGLARRFELWNPKREEYKIVSTRGVYSVSSPTQGMISTVHSVLYQWLYLDGLNYWTVHI